MNARVCAITPSVTLAITGRAKAMKAEGKTVFSFAAGEPDFDTPEHIKNRAVKSLKDGETKYALVPGRMDLREAIVGKLEQENGLKYAEGQVVVSNGAKHSLFNIFMALCGEGSEVIVPAPYWLSYPEMVRIAGGDPVFVDCGAETSYKMTAEMLEEAVTEKTVAVVLNSPSNPTGAVYAREELESLMEVVVRKGIYVIADEIYEKLVYDGVEHCSVGSLSNDALERTITVNGMSKAFSMTGWRVGYCAGPEEVIKAIVALQSHSTSSPNTFSQAGAAEALVVGDACVQEMKKEFDERRGYMFDRLSGMDGIECMKPMGAFYMFPSIARTGMNALEFSTRLLEEENVAVIPGEPFGAPANIRLSYASSMANIEGGLDRLEAFVARCR